MLTKSGAVNSKMSEQVRHKVVECLDGRRASSSGSASEGRVRGGTGQSLRPLQRAGPEKQRFPRRPEVELNSASICHPFYPLLNWLMYVSIGFDFDLRLSPECLFWQVPFPDELVLLRYRPT